MSRIAWPVRMSLGILLMWLGPQALAQPPARQATDAGTRTAMGYTLTDGQTGLPEVRERLTAFLRAHPQTAEEYIISQFKTHDVVFTGEGRSHGTRERPLFLQRLIPLLYKAGVRHLGLEMSTKEDQAALDRLLSASRYDEDAAYSFVQHWDFTFAFQEYADVFRAAWELNHRLPSGAPKFRILGIDVKPDYRRLKPGMDPDSPEARGLIVGGSRDDARDNRMADVLRTEVLSKGFKALMYQGMGHSQPKYTQLRNGVKRIRVAQLIYAEIGDRLTSVNLESPRRPGSDLILDAVAAALPPNAESLAFNSSASPAARLLINTVPNPAPVTLEDFYDGYAFLSMRSQWAPSTINEKYVTEERVKQAKAEGLLPDLPSVTADSVRKRILALLGKVQAGIDRGGDY
jgi:hypothetical protein